MSTHCFSFTKQLHVVYTFKNIFHQSPHVCYSGVLASQHNGLSWAEHWKTRLYWFQYLCIKAVNICARLAFTHEYLPVMLVEKTACFLYTTTSQSWGIGVGVSCQIYTLSVRDGRVFSCCSPKSTADYLVNNAVPSVEIQHFYPLQYEYPGNLHMKQFFSGDLWVYYKLEYLSMLGWISYSGNQFSVYLSI